MKIDFPLQKTITLVGLTILIVLDAVLAVYAAQSATGFPRSQLIAQKTQIKLLKADINRALAIQQGIPQTKADCERFVDSLYSSGQYSSAVTDDLTAMEKSSGLQIASLAFHPKELANRSLVELGMDVTVNGDYKSVVRFLNGLQRSKSLYIIDDLALASEPTGQSAGGPLRVALHLRSYLKNAS